MNNTRKFILEVILVLICYLLIAWVSALIQIKIKVLRESADTQLMFVIAFGLVAFYSLLRAGMNAIKIFAEQPLGNHEFWASIVVACLMISTTKPIDNYRDSLTFLAGLAVLILALIMARDAPLPIGTSKSARR